MDGFAVSLIVIGVRLLIPLSILRWPFAGAVASILADTYDWHVFGRFGFGVFGDGNYQLLDKLLDTWYLFFAFLATRRWTDALARTTAGLLFSWRVFGVAAFAAGGVERMLVFAPNIFESFFLLWMLITWWAPRQLTGKRLAFILLLLGIPQIIREVILHW